MKILVEKTGEVKLAALPPLALYVHIPWCVRKCPYCDFNSHERSGALPEKEYVGKLLEDLESLLPSVWGRRLSSVFIGGGTPSLFGPESIDALLSGVRARLPLEPGAEITLEANPGAVEAGRFRGFRDAGVSRISVGVQSFDDAMLKKLGRIHGADEAEARGTGGARRVRQRQPRPDVRAAGAEPRHGARRHRGGRGHRRAASFRLPAHH